MKAVFLLSALLTLAAANPVTNPPASKPCFCEPPICPLELIAECKCKNAAAQACYEVWTEKGVVCPRPTPKPCGPIARADETTKPAPTPSVVPPTYPPCAGFAGLVCPKGLTCVDDPRDECDPEQGGNDCIGICIGRENKLPCGGLLGTLCPKGWVCVDDPDDDCDPKAGGSDCIGVCIAG